MLGYKLKLQYIFIQSGVSCAFFLGGYLYDLYGIDGAATWGSVSAVMELLCVIIFLFLDHKDTSPKEKLEVKKIETTGQHFVTETINTEQTQN